MRKTGFVRIIVAYTNTKYINCLSFIIINNIFLSSSYFGNIASVFLIRNMLFHNKHAHNTNYNIKIKC